MGRRRAFRVVKIALLVIVGIAVFGVVVMALWNALMPPLFGWHALSFWQALGLLLLSRLLFGRFGRSGWRGGPWQRAMAERWAQMTPEEREQMRSHWRAGGCFHTHPTENTPGPGATPAS